MPSYCGYAGQILEVDLRTGKAVTRALDLDTAVNFLGGLGLGLREAFEFIDPGTRWSSPDNVIIFSAGPFNGTPITGSSKVSGTTKLPQAGQVGTGSGSMRFGAMLKLAGYDMAIIKGQARRPVYLDISDHGVELHDASGLWGMDLYEATDSLWGRHGKDCSVAAIGPAGENQVVPSVVLVDKIGGWFRGGGGVWGAKNLKAVVVRGSAGIHVADRKRFTNLVEQLVQRSVSYKYHRPWVDWGVMISWDRWVGLVGGYPCRNFRELFPAEEIDRRYGPKVIIREFEKTNVGCSSCSASDKHILTVKKGDLKGFTTYFSTMFGSFLYGIICGVDYPHAIALHDALQRFGLDWLTAVPMIEWALELYEKGIIDEGDTDGLVLEPTEECFKTLCHQIARREGFGAMLAGGWSEAIERIGRGCEAYAYVAKGNSPPYDGRMGLGTDVLSGLLNPRFQLARGGSPTLMSADVPLELFKSWADKIGIPYQAQARIFEHAPWVNIPRATRYAEDWMALMDCLGICGRATINRLYDISLLPKLYEALTGIRLPEKEMLMAGERAVNMERAINARAGFSRKDDQPPRRWYEEQLEGAGRKLAFQDFYRTKLLDEQSYNAILDEYFDERRWDPVTGNPLEEKLKDLGLTFAVSDQHTGLANR